MPTPLNDPLILVLGAVAVSSILWLAVALRRRDEWPNAVIGLRNGLLIGLAIVGVVTVFVTAVGTGQQVLFATLDLDDALRLGLLVGVALAGPYFWLGANLVAVGALLRLGKTWSARTAWIAPPVVAAIALGGYGVISIIRL